MSQLHDDPQSLGGMLSDPEFAAMLREPAAYYPLAVILPLTVGLMAPFVAEAVRDRAEWRPVGRFDEKPAPKPNVFRRIRATYAAGGLREVYAGTAYFAAGVILVLATSAGAFLTLPLAFLPPILALAGVAAIPLSVGHMRVIVRGREVKWWETYTLPGVFAATLLTMASVVGLYAAEILLIIRVDEEAYLPAAGYGALLILSALPLYALGMASTRLSVDAEATGRPAQLPPYKGLVDCMRRIIAEEGGARLGVLGRLWAWLQK
ncbi:uncharacterized protein LOC62_04G005386 [Vanrija pseudolonga]|uniref:Uncharacterized protein n=1 Tax=Vanrija pseudolonga TaxID=143232 RepID=A0AAF1BL78_9TREE|nr:hypothetical protein LOC62_04G005386 [Vanrija pseudolonga]